MLCGVLFFAMAESSEGTVQLESPQSNFSAGDTTYYVDGSAASLYWLLTLAVAFLYFGVLPGLTGWTPGKLLTGLRVRRLDGSPAGVGRNLLRAVLWVVDGFPYFLPGLVGFVMILARGDRRRVADLAAGTVVAGRSSAAPPRPPRTASAAPSRGA